MTTTKTTTSKSTKSRTTKGRTTKAKAAAKPKAAAKKAPAKKAPTKAKAKAPAKAPAKKAPAKDAPAPEAAARPADAFTQRQITNAIKGLKPEARVELHTTLLGCDVPRNTKGQVTMTAVKLSGLLSKAIKGGDGTLPDAVAKALKPRRARKAAGPPEPKRIDTVVEMLRRKGGSTVEEVAEAVLAAFPDRRRGGSKATIEWSRSYTRSAIRALTKGTVNRFPGTAGNTAKDDDGRWSIAA